MNLCSGFDLRRKELIFELCARPDGHWVLNLMKSDLNASEISNGSGKTHVDLVS